MEAFYEESAVNNGAKKGQRKYKIVHICSIITLSIAILCFILFLTYFPFGGDSDEAKAARVVFGFIGIQGLSFMLVWFFLFKIKARFNVSYDYCFVSGELRISKVFNVNRRKLVARIDCEDMIQVGDMESSSYDRFYEDPTIKNVLCTANDTPAEGKFFMYVLAMSDGKKLFLLECRETMLINIMRFAKRSVLDGEYVSQEKKALNKTR
jgi:hypothetical protein